MRIPKLIIMKLGNSAGFSLSVIALMLISGVSAAIPFNSFDPRSMAMGGTGVAVDDPSTAPFFNPAMLSASDSSRKYSIEFPILGVSVFDPSEMRENLNTVAGLNTAMTNSRNTLTVNATALNDSISNLANTLSILSITDVASATAAQAAISSVSKNITTVATNMMATGNNVTTVAAYINNINQLLLVMNNQPVRAEFGAATVLGIPGKEWGFAFYADAWGAMGGTFIYNDTEMVSNLSTQVATIGAALTGSGLATTSTINTLTAANDAISIAIIDCAASKTTSPAGFNACNNSLSTANTNFSAFTPSLISTTNILGTDVVRIITATNNINQNTTLHSQVHIRGVFIEESGLSISHNFVILDQSWSFGMTPKIMNLRLFDAKLNPDNGSFTNGLTSSDYLAEYNAVNFDLGVAKSYFSGWRIGAVVKNVIQQTYDFKNALTPGGIPVADGAKLKLNPQSRVGVSYANGWSTVAFDIDVIRNNPAGLERYSQFVGIGGEWSAFGWAQLRGGYHHDLQNPEQPIASIGFGVSPRIPYFKPHLDFALTVSPRIFLKGWDGDTQMGISMKAGFNF